MPGLRTRRELTEGLLELTTYPDRRAAVERKLGWDARRVLARVGELLAEEVVWHQPGGNRFSGVRQGRDAVFAMLGGMMEASQGSFAIDSVHALMGNGDMVVSKQFGAAGGTFYPSTYGHSAAENTIGVGATPWWAPAP